MKNKYNLGSKSDMRKFSRDLEKQLREKTIHAVQNKSYDIECPHCKSLISIKPGKQRCPVCNEEINFTLNIKD
ncbi:MULTISPECIES: hypothetical protein [unclassified Exiguobacterium]|uniref:hypothetical protein n=1 Tax=unclassified Exiguobacterium TaxID=2644629 RepID=UPI00135CC7F2|nr:MULTISPECIES: hypothetical protein [unclassified Exiguobacterium]